MHEIKKVTHKISSYLISNLWQQMSVAITYVCVCESGEQRFYTCLYHAGDNRLIKAHN